MHTLGALQARHRQLQSMQAATKSLGHARPLTKQEMEDEAALQELEAKVAAQSSDAVSEGRRKGSHYRNAFDAMTKTMGQMTQLLQADQPRGAVPTALEVQARLNELDEHRRGGLRISDEEYDRIRMSILLDAYKHR
jgi:hypothetical protein